MSMQYMMKFLASDIAASSEFVPIFQPGKFQEVILIHAKCTLTVPDALTTADETSILMQGEDGSYYNSIYASTGGQTAAGGYSGDGDVIPKSNVTTHEQWSAYPRLFYPMKLVFKPPSQSGDTGSYEVYLLCREMEGGE